MTLSNSIQPSQFQMLSQIPDHALKQFFNDAPRKEYLAGDLLFKVGSIDINTMHLLIEGSVEIRHSFNRREILSFDAVENNNHLASMLGETGLVRAVENCTVVIVEQHTIDDFFFKADHYEIVHLDEENDYLPEIDVIDDSYLIDWQMIFLQSSLAMNLSAIAIQNLFATLESIDVNAGETIVENRSEGDYFYIIKQGEALVKTEQNGSFKGQEFTLSEGQYFGDEALVANTIRNASITMITDGVLGRLNWEMFAELIKNQLLNPLPASGLNQEKNVIDIRFNGEYKNKAMVNSKHIPISQLRKQLESLDRNQSYCIVPANDCRSDLAMYLMRQAGFDAYLEQDGSDQEVMAC